LIVEEKIVNVKSLNLVYTKANGIFHEIMHSGKEAGHKLSRQIFDSIGMGNAYTLTRGNVLCELTQEDKGNTKEDALKKLFMTELKWIINDEQYSKLEEIVSSNEEGFSQKLLDCMCR